jgi:DNA polymerase III epsilon subunit-like protein
MDCGVDTTPKDSRFCPPSLFLELLIIKISVTKSRMSRPRKPSLRTCDMEKLNAALSIGDKYVATRHRAEDCQLTSAEFMEMQNSER